MLETSSDTTSVRVAIVGSGFAGIGAAIALKREGIEDFVVFERADDVGGTWRANTYPGCQCDVPSTLYSFSFAPNPDWSHTFPFQQEIWDYLCRVTREYGVSPHLRFGHEVTAAAWDDERRRWTLETSGGRFDAQFLVLGVGALSEPSLPRVSGLDRFEGALFHSAEWNHDHDLRGERVAVIGTGASAIQFIPEIQPQVAELQVYQRTPPWLLPHPDRPITRWEHALWRRFPRSQWLWRAGVYAVREALVLGLAIEPRLLAALEQVAKAHLRSQIADPELRSKLTPSYRLGCKRILISDDYYPALREPNVELVTGGIREVRPHSVIDGNGVEREVDTIICGTGFLVTSPPAARYLQGRAGRLLADAWRDGMSAYLGTTISGFPNAFMISGPNTGLGHTSVVYMIESQVAYIVDALRAMNAAGVDAIDVRPEVQDSYNDEIQRKLLHTVWNSGGCKSWYLDESGRNTTIWPSFTFRYRSLTRKFDPSAYELSTAPTGVEPLTPVATGAHH